MDGHTDLPSDAPKRIGLDERYACTGNRAYLVGTQNGRFPDMGHHVEDEMGGLWAHPVKLLDGFWLGVDDGETTMWLTADKFITHAVGVEHRYSAPELGIAVRQFSFVPDDTTGLVVRYTVDCLSETDAADSTDKRDAEPATVTLRFLARTDLRPTWLADEREVHDAPDRADIKDGTVVATDAENPWTVVISADRDPETVDVGDDLWGPERTSGQGTSAAFTYDLPLEDDDAGTLTVGVAGGVDDKDDASARLGELLDGWEALYDAKAERYRDIAARSRLDSPDEGLDDIFSWVKLNLDMVRRDVPGVGRGFGAGLPTYPWWFGTDGAYTVQGALPLGYHDVSKETLRTVAAFSESHEDSPRIIHEASTNGVVFHGGNAQETPHFVRAVRDVYRWTGDEAFVEECYPLCRRAMQHLFAECDDDGDRLPEGYGIMEVKGLNLELIDTAVYAWDGLDALADLAGVVDDEATREWAVSVREELADTVEEQFWSEADGIYHDMVGTPEDVLDRLEDVRWQLGESGHDGHDLLDDIEETARNAADPERDRSWPFAQWVLATPLETGLASADRARRTFERVESTAFTNPWGFQLSGDAYGDDKAMTISTGVLATAEVTYGRPDRALEYLERMGRTKRCEMPGSLSEISPDAGCCVQAWTAYGYGRTVVEGFAGIRPDAGNERLTVDPMLPSDWETMALDEVHVGDVAFDYRCQRIESGYEVTLRGNLDGWTVETASMDERGRRDGTTVIHVDTDIDTRRRD